MRAELMSALTGCWERSLEARATMNPHSPVLVLDPLLQGAACKRESAGQPRNQRTSRLLNGSQKPENEEPPGSREQDRLPNGSQTGLQTRVIQPRKGPLTCVGVAGFEPAASSSRTERPTARTA